MGKRQIVFITGTDTGVGKTVLTALLLAHLRSSGLNALAIKPFCSGSRADPRLLSSLQDGELALNEVNPFHFKEPVAPLVSARKHRRFIPIDAVIDRVESIASRCDRLLIEGAGGLLVPLGKDYSVLDLIVRLQPQVLVVARNRLGTLNHTLLTVQALRVAGIPAVRVALMGARAKDYSVRSNAKMLAEMLAPTPLFLVPFLGPNARRAGAIKKNAARFYSTLRWIAA